MLIYYATLRHFMRIATGVIMRNMPGIKKSVNVPLSPEVLELPAALTAASIEKCRENKRHQWLKENATSIEAVNQWVEENGSFSDFQRSF